MNKNTENLTVEHLSKFMLPCVFTSELHMSLLKMDALGHDSLIEDGLLPSQISAHKKIVHRVDIIQYNFFVPYIVEKLLVNALGVANRPLYSECIPIFFNSFSAAGNIKKVDDESFLKKVFFHIGYEQMPLQEGNTHFDDLYRLHELYKDSTEVEDFLTKQLGLSFEKFILFYWSLFAYVIQSKKTNTAFNIENFKSFVLGGTHTTEAEVEKFLDYLLVDLVDFRKEYNRVRSKSESDSTMLSFEKLQEIDKYLPKISFRYPFIYSKDKTSMILTSYTSLLEFMKMERLYYDIFSNKHCKDFKGDVHGPAVNNYVKNYAKTYSSALKIYGDEEYCIMGKKKYKYDAPDIIIEFEDYVLIIEMKSNPFNLLEVIRDYDAFEFSRIDDDIAKSERNIQRYLDNANDFKGKSVYKFVAYFFKHPVVLISSRDGSGLATKKLCKEDAILTDIKSIEALLKLKTTPLDKVIDEFIEERNNNRASVLCYYVNDLYKKDKEETPCVSERIKHLFKI